jgi:hypothetical protein
MEITAWFTDVADVSDYEARPEPSQAEPLLSDSTANYFPAEEFKTNNKFRKVR